MANDIEQTRGQVDSLILRTLLEQDRYGLEIYNEIKNLDNMIGTVKQPTFYNALKRLESAGLLSSYSGGISNGAKRVYYSITNKGRAYLQDEYTQWQLDDGSLKEFFTDENYFDEEPVIKQRRTRRPSINKTKKIENFVDKIAIKADGANDLLTNNKDSSSVTESGIDNVNNTLGSQNTSDKNKNQDVDNSNTNYGVRKFTFDYPASPSSKTLAEKQRLFDDLINNEIKSNSLDEGSIASNIMIAKNLNENDRRVITDTSIAPQYQNDPINLVKENNNKAIVNNGNTVVINNNSLEQSDKIEYEKLPLEKPKFKEFNTANIDYNGSVIQNKLSNVNYIDSLNDIYKNKPPIVTDYDNVTQNNVSSTPVYYDDYDEEKIKETSFNKLKQKFALENVRLKQYVRSNTPGFYIGRYYYSAKLFRDVSLIMYAVFLAFCLIVHFASKSSGIAVSVSGLIAALLVGAILPIGALIYYTLLPTRRKYANFNFSLAMISAFIILIVAVVIIVMSAFFGFKVNVADGKTLILPLLAPIIATLLIPIGVVLYGVLYNSRRYHLK